MYMYMYVRRYVRRQLTLEICCKFGWKHANFWRFGKKEASLASFPAKEVSVLNSWLFFCTPLMHLLSSTNPPAGSDGGI